MPKRGTSQVVAANITIGLQLAITILLFVFGGHYLDNRYDMSPLFVTIGAFTGMIFGFYYFIRQIQMEEKKQKAEIVKPGEKEKKRVRWM